uniref:Uncharacterized protein n=1 Tax=Vespula pensylvanica TaxID=30213 RepID=A0A834P6X4_VESPE|nr:hypothetical protein H0235_006481 [Vespula pensylvanica]
MAKIEDGEFESVPSSFDIFPTARRKRQNRSAKKIEITPSKSHEDEISRCKSCSTNYTLHLVADYFLRNNDELLGCEVDKRKEESRLMNAISERESQVVARYLVGEGGPLTFLLKVSLINPAHIVELSRGNPQCLCDTPYGLL